MEIGQRVTGEIGLGFVVLLGIEDGDTGEDGDWLVGKISRMRVFSDEHGRMNLGLKDIGGQALVVSQFTLHASTKKGNRPSFIRASRPEVAVPLYEEFLGALERETGCEVARGEFGADMKIHLINDGPVTIVMDSKNRE